jgi:hypothetical protein
MLYHSIESSLDLKDDQDVFEGLVHTTKVKKELKDLLTAVEEIESEAKGLINSKAKALYGSDWQVIDGDKFSITKSPTGDIYTINGEPNKKFIKIKKSVNADEVDNFVAEHEKLPVGIELNDKRGESLRINLK